MWHVSSIGIFEDSWDTGDSPLSKCGVEPWISYTIDDGYVYIASFQPMGRFSDFSATGK
jgi:hypothetical protein